VLDVIEKDQNVTLRKFNYISTHIDYLNNGMNHVTKYHHHVCDMKAEGRRG